MKIYISGPMTGIEIFNMPAFIDAEAKLQKEGHTVLSPAILPVSKEISHEEYMVIDLAMLSICDAIYLLDGWEESKGAKIEYEHAWKANKLVFYENQDPIIG